MRGATAPSAGARRRRWECIESLEQRGQVPKRDDLAVSPRHEALADVGEEGRQLEYDVAGLEDGEPVSRCSLWYAGVRAKGTEVGQLAHPARAQTH